MAAQIIRFPCPQKVATAQTWSSRGLHLSAQQAAVLARLNRGEVITDIGQIDQRTRRLLKRWLDKGWVRRGVDYTFPVQKTCWAGIGLWDEDGTAVIPLNIVFP